jgi:hypothetical protein
MSHHTALHAHSDDNREHEDHRLIWIGVLYVTTAVLALVVDKLTDLELVISILVGFVGAVAFTSLLRLLVSKRH